jgi:hypothetical protein
LRKIMAVVELAPKGLTKGGGLKIFYGETLENKVDLEIGDFVVFPSFVCASRLVGRKRDPVEPSPMAEWDETAEVRLVAQSELTCMHPAERPSPGPVPSGPSIAPLSGRKV